MMILKKKKPKEKSFCIKGKKTSLEGLGSSTKRGKRKGDQTGRKSWMPYKEKKKKGKRVRTQRGSYNDEKGGHLVKMGKKKKHPRKKRSCTYFLKVKKKACRKGKKRDWSSGGFIF